jgi:hypothetical protein
MAAAYAVPSRPGACTASRSPSPRSSPTPAPVLPVPSAGCHRAISRRRRRGQLHPAGRPDHRHRGEIGGLAGREAAGKTGTSNVANGDGTPYAAFAGYTPNLVGYVSVFNPVSPTVHDTMGGPSSCYRLEFGGQDCPGEMFGADAPGSTWHMTFDHADLGPVTYFVPVPPTARSTARATARSSSSPSRRRARAARAGRAATVTEAEAATAEAATGTPSRSSDPYRSSDPRRGSGRLAGQAAADLGGDTGPVGPARDPGGQRLHDLAHARHAAGAGLGDRRVDQGGSSSSLSCAGR